MIIANKEFTPEDFERGELAYQAFWAEKMALPWPVPGVREFRAQTIDSQRGWAGAAAAICRRYGAIY